MPVKRGNKEIVDIKSKGNSISVKAKSKNIFPNFVDDYISRVEDDGGTITDETALRDIVDILISNDIWPYTQALFSPAFGKRLNGSNEAEKLYNVKKADDLIPQDGEDAPFDGTGKNGNAILDTTDPDTSYHADDGSDWLKGTGLGWVSTACFIPKGTALNAVEAFTILNNVGGVRFRIYRDADSDDRLDFAVNPDDDFSDNNLSDDQDDTATFMEFSGIVDLEDQYMHSLKDQQTLREFQGSPLPSKKFPDTNSQDTYIGFTQFGFLLFANLRPTVAQRTAVFNWLDNYYAIT